LGPWRSKPVPLEERLADLDDPPAVALERTAREQHPAAEPASDHEADVVAEDRGRGGDRDDHLDAQVAARSEDAGREERGLARQRDPHRLDRDEGEQHRVADVLRDGDDGCEQHVASTIPRCPPSPPP
jgi:hypothetical protein